MRTGLMIVWLLVGFVVNPAFAQSSGCADGEREGFVNLSTYPEIAGCAGGWNIPGVLKSQATTLTPACERAGGDDGANPLGIGCNVADLCAPGWHVCETAAEVSAKSPSGCQGAVPPGAALFFLSRQASNGCNVCATGLGTGSCCNGYSCCGGCLQTDATGNDLYGCGNLAPALNSSSCGMLNQASGHRCFYLAAPWSCAATNGVNEAKVVVKPGSGRGGVLCCREEAPPVICPCVESDPLFADMVNGNVPILTVLECRDAPDNAGLQVVRSDGTVVGAGSGTRGGRPNMCVTEVQGQSPTYQLITPAEDQVCRALLVAACPL